MKKINKFDILGKEDSDEDIGPKLTEQATEKVEETTTEPKLLERDETWRKTAPVREWDKGKESMFKFKIPDISMRKN